MAQPAHVEVTVLGCTSCGAAVPFGDADTLSCVYCGATVAVPEEHRALRAAEREYNLHRDDALLFLRRLGKTPSFLVRFLTDANGLTVVGLVVVGALLAGVTYAAAYSLVARICLAVFHVHVDDVFLYRYDSNALFMIGQFAFLLAGLGALVVLGAYARKRGAGLRELQAGLSARPPERVGGPATCRGCGAPLAAKSEDLAVTCPYCRTDNLLEIQDRWLGAARASAKKVAGAVEEAAWAFREEEREIRKSLVVRLSVVAVLSSSVLFLLLGITNAASLEGATVTPYHRLGLYSFDWQEAAKSPWLVLDQGDTKGCKGLSCSVTLSEVPCAERSSSDTLVVPEGACDAEACVMHWYVALKRGDALEVTASELPPQTFIALKSHVRGVAFHEDPVAWGTEVPSAFAWLTEKTSARLPAAPHDGWFELVLGMGAAIPNTPLPFCARLERTAH